MKQCPHLIRRNAIYYLRIVVPKNLVRVICKTEIKKSLKTTSFKHAKLLTSVLTAQITLFFETLPFRINKEKNISYLHELEQLMTNTIFSKQDALYLAFQNFHQMPEVYTPLSAENQLEEYLNTKIEKNEISLTDKEETLKQMKTLQGNMAEALYYYKCLMTRLEFEPMVRKQQKMAVELGLVSSSDLQKSILMSDLENVARAIKQQEHQQLLNDVSTLILHEKNQSFSFTQPKQETVAVTAIEKTPWKPIFDQMCKEPGFREVRQNTFDLNEQRLETVLDLVNVKYIEEMTEEKAREVKRLLAFVPKLLGKQYQNIEIHKAIDMCKNKDGETITNSTIKTYISNANRFFSYAVGEKIIRKNPFQEIKILTSKSEQKQKRQREYLPFTEKELNLIFSNEMYPVLTKTKNACFFVPLLSLVQGMRLNEICQLCVKDIEKIDDIYVIHIREEGSQRAKTLASIRTIPIHPILNKLGFIKYISTLKNDNPNQQIFPELKKDLRGYYSRNITRWFSIYLDKLNITDKRKVFHSFRHTFRTKSAEAGISSDIVNILCGWSGSSVGERYANAFSIQALFTAMKKIKFKELEEILNRNSDARSFIQ